MKTQFKHSIHALHQFVGRAVRVGAVLLIGLSASGQNLFVADRLSGNVYEYTPDGTRSIFASGLSNPQGLAFDTAGNLFVSTWNDGFIYKYTPDGTRSIFASGLSRPVGLAFNSLGVLFEADEANFQNSGHIYSFTPDGVRSTFASGLHYPVGLAFNSSGDLFVSSYGNGIYKFTGGVRSDFDVTAGSSSTYALAFNGGGELFASVDNVDRIFKYTTNGVKSVFAKSLSYPYGLAFNNAGSLFVAENGSGNIYQYTPDGVRSTFATGLTGPQGLAFKDVPLPVPEPGVATLVVAWCVLFLSLERRKER